MNSSDYPEIFSKKMTTDSFNYGHLLLYTFTLVLLFQLYDISQIIQNTRLYFFNITESI